MRSVLLEIENAIIEIRKRGDEPCGIVLDESDLDRIRLELEEIFRVPWPGTSRPHEIFGLPVHLSESKTRIIILVPIRTIGTRGGGG